MNIQQAPARLGAGMPSADWTRARTAVSDPGRMNGSVSYAKPGQQYSGPVVFVTDTHLVQRVGRNAAVAHDLRVVRNGPEIGQAYEALKPNHAAPRLLVQYDADKGQAEVQPLKPAELTEVKRQALAWAQQAITSPSARDAFMKHVEGFVSHLDGRTPGSNFLDTPATRFARELQRDHDGSGTAAAEQAYHRINARADRYRELLDSVRDSSAKGVIFYAKGPLVESTAQLWARLDVSDYRRLTTDHDRRHAADAMDNKSQRYQEALRSIALDVAAEVQNYQLRNLQMSLAKEERKDRDLKQAGHRPQREPQRGIER
jgi:hypothetical protein